MQVEPFDWPLGIRLWPNERRRVRRLREGYDYSPIENSSDSFRFTAVSGAAKVPGVFRSFADCLPEESFLILEFYQEEHEAAPDEQPLPAVYYSPYLPTNEILETLEPYLPRLIHDGFVGFGLANNRAGMELFYSEEKVLTFFTGNHLRVTDMLARHGLHHRSDLLYPTDLGHDHLSLLCHPQGTLPQPFSALSETELDYVHFCGEVTQLLDMYPVEESLSFFLSKKEQDLIEARLQENPDLAEFAEEDFGTLLLDWDDFVSECSTAFEGDLWDYRQGLKLRDMIEYVLEGIPATLSGKVREIIASSDEKFQQNLTDRRKRLDPPGPGPAQDDRFWYRGMVRNQGAYLRRDLIRQGWFKPAT
ncbi:MAG: hypothetical protein C0617_11680 [Desulfuromonas sp.]|uniref:hypothetical protein n=1 Tax=Desulfuromonas sp. TaxID=892 RepID=UPI000CB19851|nr:hypothetical protein [Desulfuromonas sp.]PLX83192.1 MAG: hypothetical protein C0617_11680 [Desulfuromonas sp.]